MQLVGTALLTNLMRGTKLLGAGGLVRSMDRGGWGSPSHFFFFPLALRAHDKS